MVSKFFSGLRSRSHFFRLYAMNQVETEKTKIPENCKRKKPTTSNEEDIRETQIDKTKRLQNNLAKNKYLINFKKWPIFTMLEDEILLRIDLALIYDDGALVVTRDKMVYAIGNNKNNRLGVPGRNYILRPTKVEILCNKNLKKFACGYFMAALTKEGEVYTWSYKELSICKCVFDFNIGQHNFSNTSPIRPVKMPELKEKRIIDIVCNDTDFFILTDDGKVYNWFVCPTRHLPCESESESKSKLDYFSQSEITKYRLREEKFDGNKIVCIACGLSFIIAVTDMGKIYEMDFYSNICENSSSDSSDDSSKYLIPREIIELSNVVIVKVACGRTHALALTNEGQLYVMKKYYHLLNIPGLQKILDIAAVYHSKRSVILGDNGYIYVWGNYFGCDIQSPIITHFSNMQEALVFCIDTYPTIIFTNEFGYTDAQSDILKCSKTLFDDPSTSDFTIQIKNHSIHVHKAILRARSEYFNSMFRNFKEKDQNVMTLPSSEYSYIAYKAFLKYLYTGVIDLSMQKLLKLFKLAMMLCETKLITSCIQEIKRKVTLANVVFVYNTATEQNHADLKKFSIKFAVDYAWPTTQIEYNKKIDINILESFKEEIASASAS